MYNYQILMRKCEIHIMKWPYSYIVYIKGTYELYNKLIFSYNFPLFIL